ncbi:MAG: glycosyltransferase, partial [Planctomycetota bacterium]
MTAPLPQPDPSGPDPGRPRIVHVMHRLDRAGAEVLADQIVRELSGEFRFAFWLLDGVGAIGRGLREQGFDVVELGRRPGLDTRVIRRLRAMMRQDRPAVIHAHQYTPFFYAAAARLTRLPAAAPPILFTEHGRHYPDVVSAKRRLANRVLLRRQDRITAVGGFVRDALVEREGLPGDRIEVVYNAVDADGFDAGQDASSQAMRESARATLGLDPDTPVVMQVARFHPVKDHATSIRAIARVRKELPSAVLALIGDGPERTNLEALTHELGADDAVRFYGVRSDVADLLPAADVFALSSLSEGVSLTLLEAMAAGLPIAATDVGGNPEVVEHGQTGLLSPRRDAGSLAVNLL